MLHEMNLLILDVVRGEGANEPQGVALDNLKYVGQVFLYV